MGWVIALGPSSKLSVNQYLTRHTSIFDFILRRHCSRTNNEFYDSKFLIGTVQGLFYVLRDYLANDRRR